MSVNSLNIIGLIEIGYFGNRGVAPKLLKIVAATGFRHKDMHERIAVVNNNPLGRAVPVVVIRFYAGIFKEVFADAVGDGPDLH